MTDPGATAPQVHGTRLRRRLLAELVGAAGLVAVVVGSGIAAQQLSPGETGLQLLENSLATVFGLGVLIVVFGPVSGAHLNPVVSTADWLLGRRHGTGLPGRDVAAYAGAQTVGAILGALLANVMFDLPAVQVATTARGGTGVWVGEVVATAGLIMVIFTLARSGRAALSAVTVAGYIGAAYWFTSSTSFANPAVTVGRMFSDTFAGIAPGSVPGFVAAQLLGAALGAGLALALHPDLPQVADQVVVPHIPRDPASPTTTSTWWRSPRGSPPTGSPPSPKPKEPSCPTSPRSCSSASTTPAAPRWPPPCSTTTRRAGCTSAPPAPPRPARSTPPCAR